MALGMPSGEIASYFESVTFGVLLARCLIAAFVILAVIVSIYQLRHMRQRMHMLDDNTRVRRAQDEELSKIGCSKVTPRNQMRDPWEK